MRSIQRLVCVAGCAALAGVASADISDTVFTITATANSMSGSFDVPAEAMTGNGQGGWWWNLEEPVDIYDQSGTVLLGTLGTASLYIEEDPLVTLNFQVFAGAVNTVFSIDSALVSFAQISNVTGEASAGVTVTDNTGNGATLAVTNGFGMYEAGYNGQVPGGTTFTHLIPNDLVAGANQTNAMSGALGPIPIGVPVDDISSRFEFSLTAFDLASGTSTFEVIPAPGAFALLGLGGLVASRRRR